MHANHLKPKSYLASFALAVLLGAAGGCAASTEVVDESAEILRHEEVILPILKRASTVEGLAAPESVFFDATSKSWYVSSPAAAVKGDGFISKLDEKGKLVAREFISGLDDPRGVRVHRGILYAADGKVVVRVDLKKPTEVTRIAVPNAVLLNDLTVDTANGDVYVSDTFLNAIHRVRGETVSEVLRSPELTAPNGLVVHRGALYVATLGPDLNPTTFATSAPGRVLKVDLKTLAITKVSEPLGLLDGIEVLEDGFLVSNYRVGLLFVDHHGEAFKVQDNATDGLTGAADIGYAKSSNLVAVPDGRGTKVVFYELSWPEDDH